MSRYSKQVDADRSMQEQTVVRQVDTGPRWLLATLVIFCVVLGGIVWWELLAELP